MAATYRSDTGHFSLNKRLQMPMENADKRLNPRAQFFLLRQQDGYIPIFAFKAEDDPDAIAALVVDLSEGGVQILAAANTSLDSQHYQLEFTRGEPGEESSTPGCQLLRMWSRQEGMYVKSGFSFAGDAHGVRDLLSRITSSEHHLLRCVLHPLR